MYNPAAFVSTGALTEHRTVGRPRCTLHATMVVRVLRAALIDMYRETIVLLGSGQRSGVLAAERGRAFAAAYHFGPLESAKAIQAYKANFQPSAHLAEPYALASVSVICAESQELAEGLKLAGDLSRLRRLKHERGPAPTIEEARAYPFTPEELEQLAPFAPIYGTPDHVERELHRLATDLNADELILVININDHVLRRRSHELIVAQMLDAAVSSGLVVITRIELAQ